MMVFVTGVARVLCVIVSVIQLILNGFNVILFHFI